MVCSQYFPAGLHGCEGSALFVNALGAFRSAVARAIWSEKLPMTKSAAVLILFDGAWGSDPAFYVTAFENYIDICHTGLRRKTHLPAVRLRLEGILWTCPVHLLIDPA